MDIPLMTNSVFCTATMYCRIRNKSKQFYMFAATAFLLFVLHVMKESKYDAGGGVMQRNTLANYNRDIFPPKRRRNPISSTEFQTIASDFSLLIYSAYIDVGTNYVLVIGIIRKDIERVNCVLFFNSTQEYKTVKSVIQLLPEDHKVRHTAVHVLCPISTNHEPDAVSLTVPDANINIIDLSKLIPITKIRYNVMEYRYTTCVSPLHSNYNNVKKLIEWIEMNQLLGSENIIFYISDVSDDVMAVLHYYELFGLVTIHKWTLPELFTDLNDRQLHYFGQLAALNDCIYQTKGVSEYVAVFDIDEYIIPQQKNAWTWSDMIAESPGKSVYIFRCNFFSQRSYCSNVPSCRDDLSIKTYMMKDSIILPPKQRSKYIVRPADVIIAGVHFVWNTTTGSEFVLVEPEVGLLHHYRADKTTYTHERILKSENHVTFKYLPIISGRTKLIMKYFEPFLSGEFYDTIDLVQSITHA